MDERARRISEQLADAIERVLPRWVEESVRRVHEAWAGHTPEAVRAEASRAGAQARSEVGARVRALLERPFDEQWTNPLHLLRDAVSYPTAVLRDAGVPPVERDQAAEAQFPADEYDLTPASFHDVGGDELHELGIAWGAAKAHDHLQRRGRSHPQR